jgi:hypothetical protein
MIGKHKFRKDQRVRLSTAGKYACICKRTRREESGIVTRVDEYNSPTVLWDYRKTTSTYHPDFIEPDRRRHSAQTSAEGNKA